jgi:hypothetical protein
MHFIIEKGLHMFSLCFDLSPFFFFFGCEAMKDRSCKKPSPSVKNEMNKDVFQMSLAELDIPNMDAHRHRMSLFNNTEKGGS